MDSQFTAYALEKKLARTHPITVVRSMFPSPREVKIRVHRCAEVQIILSFTLSVQLASATATGCISCATLAAQLSTSSFERDTMTYRSTIIQYVFNSRKSAPVALPDYRCHLAESGISPSPNVSPVALSKVGANGEIKDDNAHGARRSDRADETLVKGDVSFFGHQGFALEKWMPGPAAFV
nr:hypothetical protein [Paraburkholderia sp. BL8N3]